LIEIQQRVLSGEGDGRKPASHGNPVKLLRGNRVVFGIELGFGVDEDRGITMNNKLSCCLDIDEIEKLKSPWI